MMMEKQWFQVYYGKLMMDELLVEKGPYLGLYRYLITCNIESNNCFLALSNFQFPTPIYLGSFNKKFVK
jgi:hypothetical protein